MTIKHSNIVEQDLRELGLYKIAGCDESGRGPLSGPVVGACVILPFTHKIEGLRDSKKLSKKRHKELGKLIYKRAIEVRVVQIENTDIDKYGILPSTIECFRQAISRCKVKPEIVAVDGVFTHLQLGYPCFTIEKGEDVSDNIAAASIIAKVYRDNLMGVLHKRYPMYGWDTNSGYGTKKHIAALYKYGPCPLHRQTFTIKGVPISSIKGENGRFV